MPLKIPFRGKYCTKCGSVWELEISPGGPTKEIKYSDFPSFGLERQDCSDCNSE